TVDAAIAFVGGMGLTAGRWDTSSHPSTSPLRVKPSGEAYGPVHDVQAIFRGPAARPIVELARRRWKWATGEEINPDACADVEWPSGITPDIEHAELAVARTVPGLAGLKSRRETIRLTLDAIAAARSSIYIETQYLASFRVCDALARRL